MGRGTLRLYKHVEQPRKRWLVVRNLVGKVMLTAGLGPGMKFDKQAKGSAVGFVCRPVKDDGTLVDAPVRLNIKVRRTGRQAQAGRRGRRRSTEALV